MIPEQKPPNAAWSTVTIQIPVYKESLQEVLMPTLKSCMKSRDYYTRKTGARCNIVVCDDGMMAFLKNNFAAAEMLWETVSKTKGKIFKLSKLLQKVPRPSRRHLKGLKSHSVYEVFHRMLFYYHYDVGFVARSTWDRRGKFKKASNLNSHLRLAWGAGQLAKTADLSLEEALMQVSHNNDGSRDTMFGNDVRIGNLIVVNDADARMSESVILKTVPEFLNDKFLGFTQHATKVRIVFVLLGWMIGSGLTRVFPLQYN
jgi:cellulose synthase/poly-beta-1,6-N-acetylglucosamine synthase-like glycosyltransferase